MSLEYTEIFDISMPLKKGMVTYPNNPPYNHSKVQGSSSLLHKISMGTHSGTHIDAPNHVIPDAPGVNFYPLSDFIGECRVIDCTEVEGVIELDDIKDVVMKKGERVLIKTKNSERVSDEFQDDFIALSPAAAEHIASQDIALIGVDYLSIKQRGVEDGTAHTAFLSKGIPIAEGLVLTDVQAGLYTLILLPIALGALDAAPARAVLVR